MTTSRWCVAALSLAGCLTCLSGTASGQDTTRKDEPLARLDFQNADLQAVIAAIAETGGLQVTSVAFPRRRISLHLPEGLTRADMLPLLLRVAEANGLRVVRAGTMLHVENAGDPAASAVVKGPSTPRDGATLFVYKLKHARAPQLAATLQAMNAPRYRIIADVPANALLIQASPTDYLALRSTIDSLDVRPLQVVVEVELVEVRRHQAATAGPRATPASPANDFIMRFTRGGAIARDSALSILAREGEVRVTPQPLIMTENNLPVHVPSSTGNDAELDLSATVQRDGLVNLSVTQNMRPIVDPAADDTAAPRHVTSHLQVRDDGTGVIAALADGREEQTSTGIPVLRSIPFYGQLFGTTSVRSVRGDLYIFITPHIVATDDESARWRTRMNTTGLPHTTVTP